MSDTALSAALELRTATLPAGEVVLSNAGTPVRLWRQGNEWGDSALSFVLSRGETRETIMRKPQDYTRNVPSSYELPSRGSERLAFDLGDGSWEPDDVIAGLANAGGQLAAVFEITPTPESAEHGVWTGRVQSDFVSLG